MNMTVNKDLTSFITRTWHRACASGHLVPAHLMMQMADAFNAVHCTDQVTAEQMNVVQLVNAAIDDNEGADYEPTTVRDYYQRGGCTRSITRHYAA